MLTIFSQTLRRGKFTTNTELKAFDNIRLNRAKAKAALILSWAVAVDLMISSAASLMAAVAAVVEAITSISTLEAVEVVVETHSGITSKNKNIRTYMKMQK